MAAILSGPAALVLITSVERRLSAALAQDLEREGVTLDQWRVLNCLDTLEGRTMSDVAIQVMVPPPTLTKLVDRLVASNLVHRRSDPEDRRRVLVLLTPRGRALRQQLHKVVQQHQQHLIQVLGEGGYDQLTDLLVRLHAEASP